MTEAAFIVLGSGAIVGVQLLVWGLAQRGADRDLRSLQLQIMDAWRLSMEKLDRSHRESMLEWQRSHAENMAFHRDASVALRALLERSDRE